MKTEQVFDLYSKKYIEKFNSNPVVMYQRQIVHEIIKPTLSNAMTLLDVGCGPGSDFEYYKNFNAKVTAIDISPKMVQLAKNRADSIQLSAEIYNSSLESFETEKKFDVIVLNFGVINVFKNIYESLHKLERLLNSGGRLFIISMPPFHLYFIFEKIFRFQFKQLYHRLLLKKAILDNGFEFYYYSRNDFNENFKIKKIVNLCSILPTPDQYIHYKLLRLFFKICWKLDKRIGNYLPALFGGDHILFELEKK